ncbi:MAG TPA: hypothetical protein DCE80_14755 [Ignavibacteriales bacterium]|nr:hypothetical protein [Ignavibacteriales bacterium]
MNLKDESMELEKLFNQTQKKLGERISQILMSIDGKEKRLQGLRNMKTTPSIQSLQTVYEIGLKREDYETCEAVKEYCIEKGLKLQ